MFTISYKITTVVMVILCAILTFLFNYLLNKKNKKQLDKIFIIIFGMFIFWMLCMILQIFFVNNFGANPIYFEYFVYLVGCFLPVAFFFMSLIFAKTKITFKKKYLILFVIPVISLLLLWTNDFHHLFYKVYSTNNAETVFGDYFIVHSIYSYVLYAVTLFILMKYSVKNSGFFSKQAILILVGTLIPILTNILGFGEIAMSVYFTPISLTITVLFYTLAIFKFNLFKVTPIALQRIVDRISDSYVILNENGIISDYNATFINTFHIKNSSKLRGKVFEEFDNENNLKININKYIEKIIDSDKTITLKIFAPKINKHFNVEITSIIDNGQFLGILVLFKDITQHIEDMQELKDSQDILMEKERLATLGQMIGGIAHNLKTPIMSISGASEGLEDLVNEYDSSIDDPEVTSSDHHAIVKDMREWIEKIRSYDNYMSDIITAVKGQAVSMNETQNEDFTIEELLSRVYILMKHELKAALVTINEDIRIDKQSTIFGNINSLVQVVNNLISNAIYSYGPADSLQSNNGLAPSDSTRTIDLIIYEKNGNIIISVVDHGCGMSKEVQNKLFKEMITTKGHNGSGLGLFMSYSTIKGNFQGDINFVSEEGKGTCFNIVLPERK